MHTYYQIPSHLTCSVSSLKGASYVDKTKDAQIFTEDREATVTDGVETDRVYQDIGPRTLTLDYGGEREGQGVKVEFKGYKDCTVWNPAEEKVRHRFFFEDWSQTDPDMLFLCGIGQGYG
jgi:D-hexose-6-phosphate mutarotase